MCADRGAFFKLHASGGVRLSSAPVCAHNARADSIRNCFAGDDLHTYKHSSPRITPVRCCSCFRDTTWPGVQIVRAVSHSNVLSILAAVYERNHPLRNQAQPGAQRPRLQPPPKVPLGPYVGLLLPLLPRSFHPAVVRTCCLDPTDRRSCDLRVLDTELGISMTSIDDKELTQLLAAAAPLAGGCMELANACVPCTHMRIERQPRQGVPVAGSSGLAGVHACGDGAEAGCGSEWRLPEGGLTRLQIGVDGSRQPSPASWCNALAQLCTLQSLAVEVAEGPLRNCMPDFMAALRSLPALSHLCIKYEGLQYNVPQHASTSHLPGGDGDRLLLEGVAMLTQLQSLDLDRCFNAAANPQSMSGELTGRALAQLTQLSRLTCLRYTGAAIASKNVWQLADSIRSLASLQELHVVLLGYKSRYFRFDRAQDEPSSAQAGLLLNLFESPGLPLLQHLEIGVGTAGHGTGGLRVQIGHMPVAECHACMRRHNPALLARLTGLRLGPRLFGCEPEGGAVAALLGDTPALRSLRLNAVVADSQHFRAGTIRSSRDFLSIAGVLPGMTGLTHLDVSCCGASGASVLVMLTALARPGTAVCEGLREGDIGCNDVGPQHAAELAGVLRHFRGLEQLGMRNLGLSGRLGLEALGVILPAVAGLPQLRAVDATQNCGPADRAAAWDLTAGLEHVCDILL